MAALAAVILLISSGCASSQIATGKKHTIALVTKSTTSAFWHSVKAGAGAAAAEYNLDFTFEGPEKEEDYETQNRMIREAVERGAEALVISAVDYNANAEAVDQAAKKGLQIVVIDSDVNSANGQQREEGFRRVIQESPRVADITTINVISTTEDARIGTEKLLKEHPEINAIVTFNEWTSLGVGWAIRGQGLADATRVVAFDSNVVNVGMLETGEVDALIVQNPYAMGYLGVEAAYRLLNGQKVTAVTDTDTVVVTRENMYDEACQRILFTFEE